MWVAFTGGECFLREDIKEILDAAMYRCPSVSVTTNGSLPERIESAVKYALKWNSNSILTVNVSLDGLGPQHDEFTGRVGSFERATETIQRLKALNDRRISLNVENLISDKTREGRDWVRNYVRRNKLKLIYTIEMRAGFYHNEGWPLDGNHLPDIPREMALKNPFTYLYMRQAKRGKIPKCVAGQYTISITPEGNVKPCWFLDNVLYNIRETDYKLKDISHQVECPRPCWTPCEAYPTMMYRPWRVL